MDDYISLVFRCIFFYFLIIFYLRMMGKREVGELSVFDLVLYFLMSELLAISISNIEESMMKTILPVTTMALLQILLAWILLKSKKIRDRVEGKPAILVFHGVVQQREMRRHRYTIDDLMFQVRSSDVSSLSEVEFAVLENSGLLSVLKKGQCCLVHPFPLISDGEIQECVLKQSKVTKGWLLEKLRERGYEDEKAIFICLWEKSGLFLVEKENLKHTVGMKKSGAKHAKR